MDSNTYIISTLVQLLQAAYNFSAGASQQQSSRIFQLLNSERLKAGLHPLTANIDLEKLAMIKCKEMGEKDYFSHQSPSYGSPFDMLLSHGVQFNTAGENLAIDANAEHAHTAWMNSPEHRKNILYPNFTQAGIGIYPKGNGSYLYAQLFIG